LSDTRSFLTIFRDEAQNFKTTVREYKFNHQNQVEILNHVDVTELPKISFMTTDPDGKYLAIITGNVEKGAKESILE